MSAPAVMGVDPGTKGGVVVLGPDGRVAFARGFTPGMTEDDAVLLLFHATTTLMQLGGWECYLEKVGYIQGDGAQGSFTFGKVYGLIRGYLKARGVKIRDVFPQMWQARLECLSRGDKNVTKRRAIELFPELKVTHTIADAALIAQYGRLVCGL